MDLVELGARSMFLVDLEFLELRCLARKTWSGVIFSNLELLGALPNTPRLYTLLNYLQNRVIQTTCKTLGLIFFI
jgi:hypothetical protein